MYHYTECGLKNVYLLNGYKVHDTPYGPGVSIEDADGLHRAIALWLVHHKARLTGAEFRFLRKELEMSQMSLASYFGNDVQSVARWEKRQAPRLADRFLRAIYREIAEGNAHIQEIVDRLNAMDPREHPRLEFEETTQGWQSKAA